MTGTAIDTKAVEAAKRAAGILPQEGMTVVLEYLLSAMSPEAITALSPGAQQKLLKAIPSATTSQAVSEIRNIDGHNAVVGQITVNGRQLDTLLSEWSFNKSREDQKRYAEKCGGDRPYRMATRKENRAYVEGLLEKEYNNTINAAEKNALQTYRERYVRDTTGGLCVVGSRVRFCRRIRIDHDRPDRGALFVRASAESK